MAKVSSNGLILTERETKALDKKLDNITMPHEWVDVVVELFEANGFSIILNWSPQLKTINRYNKEVVCWIGRMQGTLYDVTGKGREVYSIDVESKGRWNLLRRETGSGGGGMNFSYPQWYLDVSRFPKMAELHQKELDKAFTKNGIEGIQKEYDNEINLLCCEIRELKDTAVWCSTEVKEANMYIKKAKEILKLAEENKAHAINLAHTKAIQAWDKPIPKPFNHRLNPSSYLGCKAELTISGEFVGREIEVEQDKIQQFIDKHAELFI